MVTELQERATAFMDANPVFRRDETREPAFLPALKDGVSCGMIR